MAGGGVPNFDGFVVGSGGEEAGIGGEGEVGNALVVAVEVVEKGERGGGEGEDCGGFVGGGGGEEVAVGGEFDGGDCAFVGH